MSTNLLSNRILLALAILLSAGVAVGDVGDLTYAEALPAGVLIDGPREAMTVPAKPAAIGLTHPKALVTADDAMVKVAFDAENASSRILDVARIAAPGRKDFAGAVTVKMTKRSISRGGLPESIFTLAPHPIEIVRGDKRIPALVWGRYHIGKARRVGYVFAQVVGVSEVRFGDQTRKVIVQDTNYTLVLGDVFGGGLGVIASETPDNCRIATAKGEFPAEPRGSYVSLGQPVRVNGKWYTLVVRDMKITATPLPGRLGSLTIDAPRWECAIYSGKWTLTFDGGANPVEVPAGRYQMDFRLYQDAETTGPGPSVQGHTADRSITITAGKTTDLSSLGKGLTATISATVSQRRARFTVRHSDAAGSRIRALYGVDGNRAQPPRIEVVDKASKVIYIAKLAYG